MPQVKSISDIANPRAHRVLPSGFEHWRTTFWAPSKDRSVDSHVAFLQESTPQHVLRTHFHTVDQFQIIYIGDGTLGRYPLKYGKVHFSRAYTPYGPIKHGADGLGFITLRAHRDPGAQKFPESRDALMKIPNRHPWQITEMPDFDIQPDASGVAIKAFENMHDERGLAAYSCVMKPGARMLAPDPSKGDGQYIVVMKGGIVHEGHFKKALSLVWVARHEGPFPLEAGAEGCQAVVVNFPIPGGGIPAHLASVAD